MLRLCRTAAYFLLFLWGALFSVLIEPAWADDTSLGRLGEGVSPISSNTVRMVEEDILIILQEEKSLVDCTFTFQNTEDKPVKILMGFPAVGAQPDPDRAGFGDDTSLHNFRTWIKGKAVPVKLEKGIKTGNNKLDFPHWYTWEVEFGPYESLIVKNSYWVKNTFDSIGNTFTGYVLTTGAPWQGSIGKVWVTLDLGSHHRPYDLVSVKPNNFQFTGDTKLVWYWEDLEPDFNIHVVTNKRRQEMPVINSLHYEEYDKLLHLEQEEKYREAAALLEKTSQRVPLENRDNLLARRAENLKKAGLYHEALVIWENIVKEKKTISSAYWGIANYSEKKDQDITNLWETVKSLELIHHHPLLPSLSLVKSSTGLPLLRFLLKPG